MDLPKYRMQDVMSHNEAAGWTEWGVYRGKVYEVQRIIDVFEPFVEKNYQGKLVVLEEKREEFRQQHANDKYCGLSMDELLSFFVDGEYLPNNTTCKKVFPRHCSPRLFERFDYSLLHIVTKTQYDENIHRCVIGLFDSTLSQDGIRKFREEVGRLLDDLVRDDFQNELSPAQKDYLHQVQRCFSSYGNANYLPNSFHLGRDPNQTAFCLPDGIRNNPCCLRSDVHDEDAELDTEIPEEGAWRRLPDDVIRNDVIPKEERQLDPESRERMKERMKERRLELVKRFQTEYRLEHDQVLGFHQRWAEAMEQGETQFQQLCQQ